MSEGEIVVGSLCKTINFAIIFSSEEEIRTPSLLRRNSWSVPNGTFCTVITDNKDSPGVIVLLETGEIGFVLRKFLRVIDV